MQAVVNKDHFPSGREFGKLLSDILGPESSYYKVVLVYSVAISLLTLAIPISVQMLIDSVANTGLPNAVLGIGIMLFLLLTAAGVLYALRAWTMELFSRRLFSRITGEIAMTGLIAQVGYFEQGRRSALFNRFFDIMTLKKNIPYILSYGFTLLLQTAIGLIVVSLYHFYFFLFSIVVFLTLWVIWKTWGWQAIRSAFELSEAKHEMASWLQGFAVNNAFFKTRQSAEYALHHTDEMIHQHVSLQKKHFWFSYKQLLSLLFLYALASAVLLVIGGWLVINGQLTLGQLVAAELIMSGIFYSLPQLSGYLDYYYDVCAAVEELSRLQHVVTEKASEMPPVIWPEEAELKLRKVSVRQEGEILKYSCQVPGGSSVRGRSESGGMQHAFCALLRNEISAHSGSIELGSIDLQSCSAFDLRSAVRVIDRQTLVPYSIRQYLSMQTDLPGAGKLQQVLEMVGLDQQIAALPKGLDTVLSYSAAPLLLDQALRLKIAQAFLGQTRVLVLSQIFDCLPESFMRLFISQWKERGGILIYFTARTDIGDFDMALDLDNSEKPHDELSGDIAI